VTESRVLTIPNLVSFARLASVPALWWLLLAEERVALAALLVLVVGGTDWVDGFLARRLDQVTRFGALLDPVADRLMIASAVIAGLIAGVLPAAFAVPLMIREVIMALVTVILLVRRADALRVRSLGKVATFLLYAAVPSFYLAAAGVAEVLFLSVAWATGLVGLVLYWAVLVQYLGDARRAVRDVESPSRLQES
jgi:cardiolipin synthase (CMP-forming)